jgi:3-phosphoglycerate kinase
MQINNSQILLRCDFNEPVENTELLSTKRIDANLNTIHELLAKKNKIILISHHSDKGQTLKPVYEYIKKIFPEIYYLDTTNQNSISLYLSENKKNNSLPDLILLENTRLFFDDNLAKNLDENNSEEFAKFLASTSDYFVYDAFSVGHREHASTTGTAKMLPTCFGLTFNQEYSNLSRLNEESESTLVIMGGAKLSTKLPIIEKFLNAGSIVCVGGAMVHPIIKNMGTDIKDSFTESDVVLGESVYKNKNIILPKEYVWDEENTKIIDDTFDSNNLERVVAENGIKNILWNGPVGMYETGNTAGTDIIKNFLEKMNSNNINTVVGGGDTLTYLENHPDFTASYISLSGGAMLTFLSDGTLPILEVVRK